MKFLSVLTAILALLAISTTQSLAVHQLNGSPSAQLVDQSFAIDLDVPSRIHVSDANPLSQGFSVYDNDNFVGETTTTARQGYFNLDKGHHLITVKLKDPTTPAHRSGYIRIEPVVEQLVQEESETVIDQTEEFVEDEYFVEEVETEDQQIQEEEVLDEENGQFQEGGDFSNEEEKEVAQDNIFENKDGLLSVENIENAEKVVSEDFKEEEDEECEEGDGEDEDYDGEDESEEDKNKEDEECEEDDDDEDEEDDDEDNEEEGDENEEEGEEVQDKDERITLGGQEHEDYDYLTSLLGEPQDTSHTITLTTTVTVNIYGSQTIDEVPQTTD